LRERVLCRFPLGDGRADLIDRWDDQGSQSSQCDEITGLWLTYAGRKALKDAQVGAARAQQLERLGRARIGRPRKGRAQLIDQPLRLAARCSRFLDLRIQPVLSISDRGQTEDGRQLVVELARLCLEDAAQLVV
jgi:hypothetical protein